VAHAATPGDFAKTIISEILRLAFFDSLQNEAGDEFGLVNLGVMSRGSTPCARFDDE
jgi:hypothetical protein